jgi:hypothetical protein
VNASIRYPYILGKVYALNKFARKLKIIGTITCPIVPAKEFVLKAIAVYVPAEFYSIVKDGPP